MGWCSRRGAWSSGIGFCRRGGACTTCWRWGCLRIPRLRGGCARWWRGGVGGWWGGWGGGGGGGWGGGRGGGGRRRGSFFRGGWGGGGEPLRLLFEAVA